MPRTRIGRSHPRDWRWPLGTEIELAARHLEGGRRKSQMPARSGIESESDLRWIGTRTAFGETLATGHGPPWIDVVRCVSIGRMYVDLHGG